MSACGRFVVQHHNRHARTRCRICRHDSGLHRVYISCNPATQARDPGTSPITIGMFENGMYDHILASAEENGLPVFLFLPERPELDNVYLKWAHAGAMFGVPSDARTPSQRRRSDLLFGAGDGNRTRVVSLGSSSSTIEPRPQCNELYPKGNYFCPQTASYAAFRRVSIYLRPMPVLVFGTHAA